MKNAKILLAISLVLAMVFALCACSVELGGEETWEYSADDKEGTVQLFNDFFAETFKNTNQTVTANSEGKDQFVETIDGTSDYATYSESGAETWSFIKDDEYIYAMTGEDTKYYTVSEEYYGYGYFAYKRNLDFFDMLPEEGITYSCEVKGSSKDGSSNSTLTLEVKNGDEGSITINASSKDDLVDTITLSSTQEGATVNTTMTIVYGSASVTTPDISDWPKEDFGD